MLFDQLRNLLHQRISAHTFFADRGCTTNGGGESARVIVYANRGSSLTSFDDNFDLTVFLSLRLQNARNRPDLINLIGRGLIDRRIVLRRKKNRAVGSERNPEVPGSR